MKYSIISIALALLLLFPALTFAKEFQLVADPSVPAATGTVNLGKDPNGNFKVKIEVHHLAKPSSLTPPKQAYVVWVQARGGPPENLGQLKVNDKLDGRLEATTPHEQFDLFITAEDNVDTQTPSAPPLLHTTVTP